MKNIPANIILCLSFLLLTSCGSTMNEASDDQPFETIKIDLDRIPKVKMSTLFDEVEYIPLETNGKPLGRGSCRMYGNKIYFFEKYQTKRLSVFDLEGKLNLMLHKEGRGPGEFGEATSYYINEDTGIIEILDNIGRRINFYDSLGNFIGSKRNALYPKSFIKHRDKYYFWLGNKDPSYSKDSSLVIAAYDFTPLKRFFPFSEKKKVIQIGGVDNFNLYNDTLYLAYPLNDTIYQITHSDEVVPKFVIDFGKHKLPDEIYNRNYKDVRDFRMRVEKEGLVLTFTNPLQNDGYLLFNFRSYYKSNLLFDAFYSKKSRKVYYSFNIENDLDRGIFGRPFHITNDHLYAVIQPFELLQKIREESTVVHKGTKLWKLLQQIDENSNPVVMKCRFKKTKPFHLNIHSWIEQYAYEEKSSNKP